MEGIILLLIFAILFVVLMLLFKCRSNKQEYDERQLIIRAEGYKRGFFTMLVMIFILVLINEVGIKVPFDNNFFLFAVIMLGVDVYAIHTIENGAFFSINDKGMYYIVMVGIVTVCNGVLAVGRIIDGTFKNDGGIMFSNGGSNVVLTIGFLVMFAAFIHKYIKERKGYEES